MTSTSAQACPLQRAAGRADPSRALGGVVEQLQERQEIEHVPARHDELHVLAAVEVVGHALIAGAWVDRGVDGLHAGSGELARGGRGVAPAPGGVGGRVEEDVEGFFEGVEVEGSRE